MFGFKKTPKKMIAQHDTGYRHGLAFINNDTRWVVAPPFNGILVVGPNSDSVGSRLVNTLLSVSNDVRMIDFKGTGLVSGMDIRKATTLASVSTMVKDLHSRLLSNDASDVPVGNDGPQSPASGDYPLLVINGLHPEEDAHGEWGIPRQHDTVDELGVPKRPDLDASMLDAGYSRETLTDVVGDDIAISVENAIMACKVDTQPAVLVRWAILDRLSRTHGEFRMLEQVNDVTPPDNAIILESIEELKMEPGESVMDWARRQCDYSPATMQAALVLTQCDDRIGLPWKPMGDEDARREAIQYIRGRMSSYDAIMDDRELTPLQKLWSDIATIMRLSDTLKVRVVIVCEEPSLDALADVLQSVQVRVIAGQLAKKDEWAEGTVNENEIMDYGTGDMQVVSKAKIGRFHTTAGTLRSPRMYADTTRITII